MLRHTTASFAGALLLLLGVGSDALAQSPAPTTTSTTPTTPTSTTPPSTPSPYESLSPGNQKIANALFEAQQAAPSNGTTGTSGTTTTATPLTRDEIAAMKQSGQGWGQVFKEMKAQGLVQEKNLGQVVSRSNHTQKPPHSTSGGSTITTASGRQYKYQSGSSSHNTSGYKARGHGNSGERAESGGYAASGQYKNAGGSGNSGGHGSRGVTYTAGGHAYGKTGSAPAGGGSGHGGGHGKGGSK